MTCDLSEKVIDLITKINDLQVGNAFELNAIADMYNDLQQIYGKDAEKELIEILELEYKARFVSDVKYTIGQYAYPNEVDIVIEDGKRVAYLKPNYKAIRLKNEKRT